MDSYSPIPEEASLRIDEESASSNDISKRIHLIKEH